MFLIRLQKPFKLLSSIYFNKYWFITSLLYLLNKRYEKHIPSEDLKFDIKTILIIIYSLVVIFQARTPKAVIIILNGRLCCFFSGFYQSKLNILNMLNCCLDKTRHLKRHLTDCNVYFIYHFLTFNRLHRFN